MFGNLLGKQTQTDSINLPAVPLRGLTILPDMIIHFDLNRAKSIQAVEKAMMNESKLFVVAQRDADKEDPDRVDLYDVGCIVTINQLLKMPGGVIRVLAEGRKRAYLDQINETEGYLSASIREVTQEDEREGLTPDVEIAMVRELGDVFAEYVKMFPKVGKSLEGHISEASDLGKLIDQIAINLPLQYVAKQSILSSIQLKDRYTELSRLMNNEISVAQIRLDLARDVKERVDKNQQEYFLREQMRTIEEKLGVNDEKAEIDQMQEACDALEASDEIKERITKEINRLRKMSGFSSEVAVERGYVETLLEMPWDKTSKDRADIHLAEEILNRDHYGLDKVKERILEFLAVKILNDHGQSPIICLVGPPGTGKTSIAKSVAEALDKKYIRISLGGVRDEAEIRGHRRTYVGALPGRIATGLKNAGVKNPLMLLDEIDKVSSDYKGDTSAALLEVLDSEQNKHFNDHYIELPVDLSEVMFICTANNAANIPRPLLDRMEIIEVNSYTANEKFHIAKEHLIPKTYEKNGLTAEQLTITDSALKKIIDGYTREAGVRSLERTIGELCRKAAREILNRREEGKEPKPIKVTASGLKDFLGKVKYTRDMAEKKDQAGIVRGLAWTSVGGDTLEIEVNVMPGRGEVVLTGQMGDVMKESAHAGLGYVRSVASEYGLEAKVFQKNDIHIHIPEGAVPKDGPSAGITMATAMLSALANIPVHGALAMTGEVTLRGRVLPIGGLKEKLLAAAQAGITTVLIPKENEKDLEEIGEEITGPLKIKTVTTMDEVLKYALVRK